MKIEVLEFGKNTHLGSSVLRVLQNDHTPKTDLLVREVVQNSLDAARDNAEYVNIDFTVGEFISENLAAELEKVGDQIASDYPRTQKFISIRDNNTTGLTGALNHNRVDGQNYGNLVKLVYDVAKPQEQVEAGGSWGYGKTIYYRMGIGVVIFYSRIINEDDEYEERLAISMVEDETKTKTYIPPYSGVNSGKRPTKTGVAWWGNLDEFGHSYPIDDPVTIKRILSIFDIDQYSGSDTGTNVIIPYINEKEILANNIVTNKSNFATIDVYNDLSSYISASIQRWYAPRLDNPVNTNNTTYLKATVNNKKILEDKYFTLIKSMFNYAITNNISTLPTGLDHSKLKRTPIMIQNMAGAYLSESEVGYLVYGSLSYKDLNMQSPGDITDVYYKSNISYEDTDNKPAIFTYCRRPGMIINYESKTDWTNSIFSKEEDEYIIGIFVLNSDVSITFDNNRTFSLEEYVRQSEQADHVSWQDHSKFGNNPGIIRRFKNRVRVNINDAFKEEIIEAPTTNDGKLGMLAGKLFLPPSDFGKRASMPVKRDKPNTIINIKNKESIIKVMHNETRFFGEYIEVPYEVKIIKDGEYLVETELYINVDGTKTTISKYEESTEAVSPIFIGKYTSIISNRLRYEFDQIHDEHNVVVYRTKGNRAYKCSYITTLNRGDVVNGTLRISSVEKRLLPIIDISVKGVKSDE